MQSNGRQFRRFKSKTESPISTRERVGNLKRRTYASTRVCAAAQVLGLRQFNQRKDEEEVIEKVRSQPTMAAAAQRMVSNVGVGNGKSTEALYKKEMHIHRKNGDILNDRSSDPANLDQELWI